MRGKSIILLAAALLQVYFASVSSAIEVSFQGLGDLPGGNVESFGNGVSGDGSIVVGHSDSYDGFEAFYWTEDSSMVRLDYPSGDSLSSQALDISADGSTIVGVWYTASSGYKTFRWTKDTGMETIVSSRSGVSDVSVDGSVVVGGRQTSKGWDAYRWTQTGIVGLGDLPGGGFMSQATGVSSDGSVIVGHSQSSSKLEAFRWTQSEGMVGLGQLTEYGGESTALCVSNDGSIIGGRGWTPDDSYRAFRWTEDTGMVDIGPMGGYDMDMSADGSIIVLSSGYSACIWDEAHGVRDLKEVLELDFGLNLQGWILADVRGISADGSTIVGRGRNPNGNTEAWVATIPEPGTVLLLGLGSLVVCQY